MKSIAGLIGKITELDPLAGRKVAAMIGAVVGDAACVSLEWIYSQEKMAHLTKGQDPVFFPTSHSPYYILPNGNISGYGDEAVQTLKAMSDNDGKFDELKLVQHYCNYFGDKESPYQIALATRGNWKLSTANLPVEGKFGLNMRQKVTFLDTVDQLDVPIHSGIFKSEVEQFKGSRILHKMVILVVWTEAFAPC